VHALSHAPCFFRSWLRRPVASTGAHRRPAISIIYPRSLSLSLSLSLSDAYARWLFAQALRLGTFLNETKPIGLLHRSKPEGEEPEGEPRVPLVLRLGNYLNGGESPTTGEAKRRPAAAGAPSVAVPPAEPASPPPKLAAPALLSDDVPFPEVAASTAATPIPPEYAASHAHAPPELVQPAPTPPTLAVAEPPTDIADPAVAAAAHEEEPAAAAPAEAAPAEAEGPEREAHAPATSAAAE
jgi:hypothetical protein